jgi:hypothetical protein
VSWAENYEDAQKGGGGILADIESGVEKYDPAYQAIKAYDNEYHAAQGGCSLLTDATFAGEAVAADVETLASVDGEGEAVDAVDATADAGTDLVSYDPEWASRQLADQNLPGSAGYATTDAGRTLSAHAAERVFVGGAGRAPTSLAAVDDILDTGTSVSYDSARMTIKV